MLNTNRSGLDQFQGGDVHFLVINHRPGLAAICLWTADDRAGSVALRQLLYSIFRREKAQLAGENLLDPGAELRAELLGEIKVFAQI